MHSDMVFCFGIGENIMFVDLENLVFLSLKLHILNLNISKMGVKICKFIKK